MPVARPLCKHYPKAVNQCNFTWTLLQSQLGPTRNLPESRNVLGGLANTTCNKQLDSGNPLPGTKEQKVMPHMHGLSTPRDPSERNSMCVMSDATTNV